ncbi:MAG: carboxylating nicotinate-nucleotide diphosphorylase [Bacteroidales bacterium]|nr:carboxylating nicotinate-nucleotide diphosphorylase [Bacteroidales bacterium]HNW72771.1 carboxylating nicotinate-nucleotide diphosphorylase [Bacteroidales bacterium]HPS50138.1 carboxylating nicotinate-nucleotide diphosphorylase [Bacteroidales bacterium]
MTTDELIIRALEEDLGDGDHTTLATLTGKKTGRAKLLVKEEGIICGTDIAEKVFHRIDPSLQISSFISDGTRVRKGDIVFTVTGNKASILSSERLVLNFMQRLSGIATVTARIVKKLEGLQTRVLDTRKTTPLLRTLEKYAVVTGGGGNHRMGLYDMILIKDNHVDFAGGIGPAIDAVHQYLDRTGKKLKVEIEVRNLDELKRVLEHGKVDRIMLDNFTPGLLKEAVALIDRKYETEASGGITEINIREYAETGVDFISIGALTTQVRNLDLSLKAM